MRLLAKEGCEWTLSLEKRIGSKFYLVRPFGKKAQSQQVKTWLSLQRLGIEGKGGRSDLDWGEQGVGRQRSEEVLKESKLRKRKLRGWGGAGEARKGERSNTCATEKGTLGSSPPRRCELYRCVVTQVLSPHVTTATKNPIPTDDYYYLDTEEREKEKKG